MTTLCAVKKANTIVMAEDLCVTITDTLTIPSDQSKDCSKIIKSNNILVGITGSASHYMPLSKFFSSVDGNDIKATEDVFDISLHLHTTLKDDFFLNTEEDDEDPYESSQYTALIAVPSGIYLLTSFRSVLSYSKYWAVGSGEEYALGALAVMYDEEDRSAEEIAKIAVEVGCKFDPGSKEPVNVHTLEISATE